MDSEPLFWRKWIGFVVAMWLMAFCASYPFSNYSQALKQVLNINQQDLNRLSIIRDLGDAWGGILAGVLSDYIPPGALLCFSALCGVVGYGVQWLVVSETITPLSYYTVAVSIMISGTCIPWMNSAIFNASVRNFSENKGPVVGLFKALMGLSGAIFTTLCNVLFSSSASMYLVMITIIPSSFCILSAVFFRPVPTASTVKDEQTERKSLTMFNVIACSLAMYLAVVAFVPNSLKSMPACRLAIVLVMAAIILMPVLVPIIIFMGWKKRESSLKRGVFELENDQEEAKSICNVNQGGTNVNNQQCLVLNGISGKDAKRNVLCKPLLRSNTNDGLFGNSAPSCGTLHYQMQWLYSLFSIPDGLGDDTPSLCLFKKWHFYVLFVSLVCGAGSAVAFSNNLGQIGQALGFQNKSIFISLFSLGNFVGRLAAGIVSERCLRSAAIPRPFWMGVAKVPMIVVYVWLSLGSNSSLYMGSLVLGISHGSILTLSIPIVSEFYGLKHFGTNLMVSSLYFIVGSLSFSTIAGRLYDRYAVSMHGDDGATALVCYGSHCFASTFLIFAACLTFALAMDALLSFISRHLYKQIKDAHVQCARS